MIFYIKNFRTESCNFIDAAVLTNENHRIIVNDLFKNLINTDLWAQSYALYPIIGGLASAHKFNAKDPRDLDLAYRLVFSGGITHSTTGMAGDGINGYYDTKLSPSIVLSQNNASLWVYNRTNNGTTALWDLISGNTSQSYVIGVMTKNGSNQTVTRANDGTNQTVSNTDARGFIGVSRLLSTEHTSYKNGVGTQKIINSSGMTAMTIVGFRNNLNYTAREHCFVAIMKGLNSDQASNFYNIVQAYQTALGRQV